ncbi:transposase [Photobacterium galatheae]|uniref:Transposase n=1 Tax=Photobacterium galatheae TaxID=1654360 RepID=A0A066RSU9_9GAMM|nr:transposase [Photobacterium galatheae]KDM90747.1 transposase [Photobacterium galatheae]MCM0149924.1 transposase [Photobacterium galatheae]
MTIARQQQICLEATSYYHCMSRCVRRALLCGVDQVTGMSYEHRRGAIEERLFALAKVFCIDICAYAIMNNHYHLVLHINKPKAESLTDMEVIQRWLTFHLAPVTIQRYLRGEIQSEAEYKTVCHYINTWRQRLYSISWFMRLLNQYIATEANKEDGCTGHFWEGRFKSQALLDEKAVAAAMAYVDLNPVRAGIAETPETSLHTSIKTRIDSLHKHEATAPNLYPFVGHPDSTLTDGLPFRLMDYLELVDFTGRQMREGSQGQIKPTQPSIIVRLGFDDISWPASLSRIEKGTLMGTESSIRACLPILGRQKMSGVCLAPKS